MLASVLPVWDCLFQCFCCWCVSRFTPCEYLKCQNGKRAAFSITLSQNTAIRRQFHVCKTGSTSGPPRLQVWQSTSLWWIYYRMQRMRANECLLTSVPPWPHGSWGVKQGYVHITFFIIPAWTDIHFSAHHETKLSTHILPVVTAYTHICVYT